MLLRQLLKLKNAAIVRNYSKRIEEFDLDKIRNFCIIAHVDHGKSTLADRLMELTGAVKKNEKNKQILDKLEVERQRGITVKSQTCSMIHNGHLLNLIDTPGHVDFSYEVNRSLMVCDGALLIVDGREGIQSQTVANFFAAFEEDLSIIPIINKIDMASSIQIENCLKNLEESFGFDRDSILKVSAKTGENCENILEEIIKIIPKPKNCEKDNAFSAIVFDSEFEHNSGILSYVLVESGQLKKNEILFSHEKLFGTEKKDCSIDKNKLSFSSRSKDRNQSMKQIKILDFGIMTPGMESTSSLSCGQVGYLLTNIKKFDDIVIGDVWSTNVVNLMERKRKKFQSPIPMLYAGIFPEDPSEYNELRIALSKLIINDTSIEINYDKSIALGQGFRLGFLGLLHLDVFKDRLKKEYSTNVIITHPTVPYKIILKNDKLIKEYGTNELILCSTEKFPEPFDIADTMEPIISGKIFLPTIYVNEIIKLCKNYRGILMNREEIDDKYSNLEYQLPFGEIIEDFHSELKRLSHGFASFSYSLSDYQSAPLVKLDIWINDERIDEFSVVKHQLNAKHFANQLVDRLSKEIRRQQFKIKIQAKISSKIISSRTLAAYRKDVTAKLYGGDVTRRMKLLERQREGKKKLKLHGSVEIGSEIFMKVFQNNQLNDK
ncbi:hypothetical protein SNEBB_002030 [Seison nebaliae]|nr:hypothetical protein SNEBB_002030 [Seison nebaliae]